MYCIDWEWAVRELQMDYASVRVNGTMYSGFSVSQF